MLYCFFILFYYTGASGHGEQRICSNVSLYAIALRTIAGDNTNTSATRIVSSKHRMLTSIPNNGGSNHQVT